MFELTFWNGESGVNAEYRTYTVREYVSTMKGIYAKRINGEWGYIGQGYILYSALKLD